MREIVKLHSQSSPNGASEIPPHSLGLPQTHSAVYLALPICREIPPTASRVAWDMWCTSGGRAVTNRMILIGWDVMSITLGAQAAQRPRALT